MIITCGICWDNLEPNQKIKATLCGHIFHGNCLSFWLIKDDRCPSCRVVAKRRSLIPIFITSYEPDVDYKLVKKKEETLNREAEVLKQIIEEQKGNLEALRVTLETTRYYLLLSLVTLVAIGIWCWFMFLGC